MVSSTAAGDGSESTITSASAATAAALATRSTAGWLRAGSASWASTRPPSAARWPGEDLAQHSEADQTYCFVHAANLAGVR